MTPRSWAWIVALATLAFAIAPAVTEPFTGYTANQLPYPQPDPVLQPPGWVFSIWGVIYLWLLAGAGWGLFKARDRWTATRPPLAGALAIGTLWLAIANASPIWATVTIALMAALAITALLRCSSEDWAWQTGPTAIFAGWLTAATGVSLSVTLAGFGVLPPQISALVSLSLVLATALWVLSRRSEWPYAVGAGWALMGITIEAVGQQNTLIAGIALAGLLGISAMMAMARRAA